MYDGCVWGFWLDSSLRDVHFFLDVRIASVVLRDFVDVFDRFDIPLV